MKIEAKELRDAIARGVKSMVNRSIQLTGSRGDDPRPEYLTTAAICFSLCDFSSTSHTQKFLIRAEEMTSVIWAKTNAVRLMKQRGQGVHARWRRKKRMALQQRNATRNGNVDITLLDGTGFEHPFAIIENKGMLNLDSSGKLDVRSKKEIDKDIKRNFEFVLRNGALGGIQFGAFTFYLRDTSSVLLAEGRSYCEERQEYFVNYLRQLGLHPDIRTNVLVETLDDNLYETDAAARLKSHEAEPEAQESDPAWHLAYGVISLYRIGTHIAGTHTLGVAGR